MFTGAVSVAGVTGVNALSRRATTIITAGAMLLAPLAMASPAAAFPSGSTYYVTSCDDSLSATADDGTLRGAVLAANDAGDSGSTIEFSNGDGTWTYCYDDSSAGFDDPAVYPILLLAPLEITADNLTITGVDDVSPNSGSMFGGLNDVVLRGFDSTVSQSANYVAPTGYLDADGNNISGALIHQNYYDGAMIDVEEGSLTLNFIELNGNASGPSAPPSLRTLKFGDTKALRNAMSSKASEVKASFIGNAYYHGRAISVSNDSDGADVTLNNTFVWNNSAGDETTCATVDQTELPVDTKDFTGASATGLYTLSCEVWVDGEFGNGSGAAIYAPEKGTDVHLNASLIALNVAQGSAAIVADSVDISNQSFAFYNFSRNNQDAPIVNAGSVVLALNEVHVSDSLIADNANLGVADANRGLDEPVGGAIAVAGQFKAERSWIAGWIPMLSSAPVMQNTAGSGGAVYSGVLPEVPEFDYTSGLVMPINDLLEEDGEHDGEMWAANPSAHVDEEDADEVTDTEFDYLAAGANCGAYSTDSALTLDRVTFVENVANSGNGGALCAASLQAVNSTFHGNTAANGSGGAVYTNGAVVLVNNTFDANLANTGDEMYAGEVSKAAGNIFASATVTVPTDQCVVNGNNDINGSVSSSVWVYNVVVWDGTNDSACFKADANNIQVQHGDLYIDSYPAHNDSNAVTYTDALLDGSPAVNYFSQSQVNDVDTELGGLVPSVDERLFDRGLNCTAPGIDGIAPLDAGAYEYCAAAPTVVTTSATDQAVSGDPETASATIHGTVDTHGQQTTAIHLLLHAASDGSAVDPDITNQQCTPENWPATVDSNSVIQDFTGSDLIEANGTANDGRIDYGSWSSNAIAADVSGLELNTKYWFCITATTPSGTSYGTPVFFYTSVDAPTIHFLDNTGSTVNWVQDITTSGATFHADANTKGPDSGVIGYYITDNVLTTQAQCLEHAAAPNVTVSQITGNTVHEVIGTATGLSHNKTYYVCAMVTTAPTVESGHSPQTAVDGPLQFTTADVALTLNLNLNINAAFNGATTTTSGNGLKPTDPASLPGDYNPGTHTPVSYCEEKIAANKANPSVAIPDACSIAKLYLYSTRILLQTFAVDENGDFVGSFTIPGCPEVGSHKLKIEGTAPDGTPVSRELFFVLDPNCKVPDNSVDPHQTTTITLNSILFPNKSAKLQAKYKAILRSYVPLLRLTNRLTITGFTETKQPSRAARIACISLSKRRSLAVKSYLQSLGLRSGITYVVKYRGATNPVSYKRQFLNRRAELSFDVIYGTNPGT